MLKVQSYSVVGDDGANRLWFYGGIHSLVCVALPGYPGDWPEPDWMMARHQQQPGITPLVEGCPVCLTGDIQEPHGCNPVSRALR